MSTWAAMGVGTRGLILSAGAAVLLGSGYLVWQAGPSPEPVEAPAALAAATPKAAADLPATAVASPEPTAPILPKIDTWRVAADGEALVAGKAAPGAKVAVVVDDVPVAEGVALASGDFVLQFTLPPNPAPSLLWLSMTPPDGAPVASPEMVAIAPVLGPTLAAVAPEPTIKAMESDPEPAADTVEVAVSEPVSEPALEPAPTALLVTEEGAVVLQGDAAADGLQMSQVMIDTISYAPTGAVQVGGRGTGGAGLRLYLDNTEVAVATVPQDGRWQVMLGETAPGIYTLRVDQIDAAGQVTSRFETPFKRETLEALAMTAGSPEGSTANPEAKVVAVPTAPAAQAEAPVDVAANALKTPAEPAVDPVVAIATLAPAEAPAAEAVAVSAAAPPPVSITVQPGFTLWGIAQDRMGDGVMYVQVFDANRDKIRDPNLIYPGQVFTLPATPAP